MRNKTIFNQLIIKIIIPVIIAFIILAVFNIHNSRLKLVEGNKRINDIIADQIRLVLANQDFCLEIIENNLEGEIKRHAKHLVNNVFSSTDSIAHKNLNELRTSMGMDSSLVDIYIINREGVIINTTFKSDLGRNTFKEFGDEFKNHLEHLIRTKTFDSGDFTPESQSGKLRKYAYFPTKDGQYIIEIGSYSLQANAVVDHTKMIFKSLNTNNENITSVDLFIGKNNPVSFNNKKSKINDLNKKLYLQLIRSSSDVHGIGQFKSDQSLTRDTIQEIEGKKMRFQFIFMPRDSDIYSNSIIRIVSDTSVEDKLINKQILKYVLVFGVIVIVLLLIIMSSAQNITSPLTKLTRKVNVIGNGDFGLRVSPGGSKEIVELGQKFNLMLNKIENFYRELEGKVKERTKEIELQKTKVERERDKVVKINKSLEEAYHKIEDQNNRITNSIQYAKKIQNAILPSNEYLDSITEEFFVLNKPKDIVSGDFYWASDKGDKVIIAVADCTGHGVPGAFMSMIGNTLLNKVVNENGVFTPNIILSELRAGIVSSLNSSAQKDGMDITVICYNRRTRVLEFSGANNPMFHVRDGELNVFKGDKQPVGYFFGRDEPFTNYSLEILPNDVIYLFSDGYQDQFGGERDSKFMIGRFKKLLLENSSQSTSEQLEILNNTIENWMVARKQIDDILVLGVRF